MKKALLFLPLFLLYVLLILIFSRSAFTGDEHTYVRFATNLAHGYYSPSAPSGVNLWFGPGYPIVLLPFVLVKAPWLAAKLLNACLLLGAVVYFYHTVRLYVEERYAIFFSAIFGLYPSFLRTLHTLYPEHLALLLMAGFMFYFCRLHRNRQGQTGSLVLATVFLGYLALTKVFFGYAILGSLLVFAALYAWKRGAKLKQTALVYALALLLCLPYLSYTFSITGKPFYWGNSGGMSLYWMSTPYQNELGDWFSPEEVNQNPLLAENHKAFFETLSTLDPIERDSALKSQAVSNIESHPKKFILNWIANVGRLLFSYPYSYTPQKSSTLFYLIPNMFLVVLAAVSTCVACLRSKVVPYELLALITFDAISFLGSSLLSAYSRQFWPIVPILALWICFASTQLVSIEIRRLSRSDESQAA